MPTPPDLLRIALDYVRTVQDRTSDDAFERFYHPDAIHVEYPNAVTRAVKSSAVAELKEASARGRKILSQERYEVVRSHVCGNTVILETIWVGTLAVAVGALPVGGEMKAYFAQFFEFDGERILRQRNYDCFEPFA